MSNDDLLFRDDNTQRIFLSENTMGVVEILKGNYGYIHESIANEGFILKYPECNLFKELVYDGKVVGFCTYDFSREFITAALNNIYVLPQYRGNRLFINELKKTMEEHSKPSIMEPTRLVVELLIRYGLAKKVTESLVASSIEFVIPCSHVLSNGESPNEELSTHFYDLDICRCIHILDLNEGCVAYSSPLNYDIIQYGCLNEIDDEYFEDLIEFFKDNDVEIMNAIMELEDGLPVKNYSLEEIIGGEDNLSPYIESLIDDGHVTYRRALEIRDQIREEYEAGMILSDSLLIRLAYLFEEDKAPTIKSHDEVCPYCSMPIDSHDRYCHFCGINLDYDIDEIERNLIESLKVSKSDFKEDIRFSAYKFLKLVEDGIDFDYAIATIENMYNVSWFELRDFLDKNDYFEDCAITDRGHDFLNAHPLHFWHKYGMDAVDYTDFENYFYEHSDLNPSDICLNYLEKFDRDEFISEIIENIKSDF